MSLQKAYASVKDIKDFFNGLKVGDIIVKVAYSWTNDDSIRENVGIYYEACDILKVTALRTPIILGNSFITTPILKCQTYLGKGYTIYGSDYYLYKEDNSCTFFRLSDGDISADELRKVKDGVLRRDAKEKERIQRAIAERQASAEKEKQMEAQRRKNAAEAQNFAKNLFKN